MKTSMATREITEYIEVFYSRERRQNGLALYPLQLTRGNAGRVAA